MSETPDSNNLPMAPLGRKFSFRDLALVTGKKKLPQDIPYGGYDALRIDEVGSLLTAEANSAKVIALLERAVERLDDIHAVLAAQR